MVELGKTLVLLALVGVLLLAGCTGIEGIGSSGSGAYDSGAKSVMPARSGANYESSYAPSPAAGSGVVQSQQLIKTASAQVEVPAGTLQERYAKFKNIILAEGGQITSADYSESDTTKGYNIAAKIPPAKFEELSQQLQTIGTVKEMSSSAEDVSQQYVDVQTRISNLQAQRAELLKLYERNGTLEDLLAVENEINRVQTEIEMYQNQKLNMDRQIAMSSIYVRMYEQSPLVDRTVLEPLGQVANIFLGALGVAIIVIAGVLGFGIPVAIVLGILYVIYRKLRPKKGNAGKK